MTDISKQPTTWSYGTTKVLIICFVFFLIFPIIGLLTQESSIENITNPEKEHPSHLISLENNNSETITLFPDNIYSVYVKSENAKNNYKNDILLIDMDTQYELNGELEYPIFGELINENGETYTAVYSWNFNEKYDVELQNIAGFSIWLVNETAMLNSLTENDILVGSALGCITSVCLIPVIILWFVINRPNPNSLTIKLITEDQEQSNHVQILLSQERIPDSDELYQAIHGNDEMKNELETKIENELLKDSIPAPFADRPDQPFTQKRTNITPESEELPNVIDFPEEKSSESWKEWDG